MRQFLRGLPLWAEFATVIGVAFGYFILGSVAEALRPAVAAHHDNASLIFLAVYETVLAGALATFLALRGWTLEKIGLTPSLKDTGFGVLLFVLNYLIWTVVWNITAALSPGTIQTVLDTHVVTPGISVTAAVLVSLINPIFEEVFVCGYVISVLKRGDSPWLAINVSVAVRLGYHLYQGPLGVISIIPVGLVSAYWFAWTGRLWPVVVAHTLADLLALLSFARF